MNKNKLPIFSIFLLFLLSSTRAFAEPVFNCEAVVKDVRARSGYFIVIAERPNGVDLDTFTITQDRGHLLGQALNAQADGGIHTLVATPTEGGDTRCRDNNENLLLLAIHKN